ncbi:MAG: hypothetical protein U0172_03700 [Nitrospiraceae bacterium]
MNRTFEQELKKVGDDVADRAEDVKDRVQDVAESVIAKTREASRTLGRKADDIAEGLQDDADDLVHRAKEGATSLARRVRSSAESLKSSAESLYDQGMPRMIDDVAAIIKRHPIPAVLLGTALGYLLARNRRRD